MNYYSTVSLISDTFYSLIVCRQIKLSKVWDAVWENKLIFVLVLYSQAGKDTLETKI